MNTKLINDIYLLIDTINFDDDFKRLLGELASEEEKQKVNVLFIRLALCLCEKLNCDDIEIFKNIIELLVKGKDKKVVLLFERFFTLLEDTVLQGAKDIDQKKESLFSLLSSVEEVEEEDGLLLFETPVEMVVDREHFGSTRSQISASEFMQNNIIDEELVLDIRDLLKKANFIDDFDKEMSEEFKEGSIEVFFGFIKVFNQSGEFVSLKNPLSRLAEELEKLDLETKSHEDKMIYKEFIVATMLDLKEWANNVLFEQTAVDIHYLDESLNANILQIEMLIQ